MTVQEDFQAFHNDFSKALNLEGIIGVTVRGTPPEILILTSKTSSEISLGFPDRYRDLPIKFAQLKRMFVSEKDGVKMLCGETQVGELGLVTYCQKVPEEKEEVSCETIVVENGKLYEDARKVFKDLGYEVSETDEVIRDSKSPNP